MNPFKIKSLDNFSIEDCNEYLQNHPFGEHSNEVKKRLKKLKKDAEKVTVGKENPHKHNGYNSASIKEKSASDSSHIEQQNSKTQKVGENNHANRQDSSKSYPIENRSVVDKILWWIGVIVIVLIVGTIIIYLFDIILPKLDIILPGIAQFLQQHRWIIYPICFYIIPHFSKD